MSCASPPPKGQDAQRNRTLQPSGLTSSSLFQKAPKYQNQLILGVMAVDVSLENIKRLTPRFTVRAHAARTQTRPPPPRLTPRVFTHSDRSAAVRTQRLLLRHRPQRIRAAAPQLAAAGEARRAACKRDS